MQEAYFHLPGKHHQRRIQSNRQEEMASNDRAKWVNRHKVRNSPFPRQRHGAYDHHDSAEEAEHERKLKSLQKPREFFEERCIFNFFGRGSPGHVDFEEVAEKGLWYVEGDPAEEDGEEGQPFEVFEDCKLLDIYMGREMKGRNDLLAPKRLLSDNLYRRIASEMLPRALKTMIKEK